MPGRFEWDFRSLIFNLTLMISGWGVSCEIVLLWMPLHLIDDKSTLVQVMAWCRQATSHYLSQCWPRSRSPYGVTRPQWVNKDEEVSSLSWEPSYLERQSLYWNRTQELSKQPCMFIIMRTHASLDNINLIALARQCQQKQWSHWQHTEAHFTKQTDVLPQDLVRSRSCEIRV